MATEEYGSKSGGMEGKMNNWLDIEKYTIIE